MWWMVLAGCMSSEPVLVALGPGPSETVLKSLKKNTPYQMPEGLLVDVAHLVTKSLDEVRSDLEDQLGSVVEIVELDPQDGREIRFERGKVREVDGSIYLLWLELPRPMRRSEALMQIGLRAQVREWSGLTFEWRTSWVQGMERIRMGREERDSEFVVWVEVRRFDPRRR
jgi:hypothetical protein